VRKGALLPRADFKTLSVRQAAELCSSAEGAVVRPQPVSAWPLTWRAARRSSAVVA